MPEKLTDIELRSEEVQEILTKVPSWMVRWGNMLILALVVLILAISYFVQYPDIVDARALITTRIPPQKEFAKLTGKLDSILVKDNEAVEEGQPLAIIENAADFTDVFHLKQVMDTIDLRKDNFSFPVESLPVLFLGEIEADFALFENAYDQYELNKLLKPFSAEAVANKYTKAQLRIRLKSLQNQRTLNESELAFKKKELERNEDLFKEGVISAQEYDNKQLEYFQAERSFRNMSVLISQTKEAISNASFSSQSTEINRTREEKVLLRNVIQSFHRLKKSIRDWELSYVLSAEIEGNVSFLNFWSKNQTVNNGDLVFTIIPTKDTEYIAKLKTPAFNSGKIAIGQRVNISVANYPETEFGMLKGEIEHISAIPDKEGNYVVDVSLPDSLVTSYKKQIDFKQEMQGSGQIITEDLRLIERFFYEIRGIFQRTSERK